MNRDDKMKYETPTLETERLILKRGNMDDYVIVYEYDFTKLRDIDGEFNFAIQDPNMLVGYDTYADDNIEVFDWIVYLKNGGQPIANIMADRVNKEINSIEIAFNMHPNYWKKGYMVESIIKVLECLFAYGFDKVICGYSEGNIKSKNIGNKIGFQDFYQIKDSWKKNGHPITDYKTIMTKEKFDELYINNKNNSLK